MPSLLSTVEQKLEKKVIVVRKDDVPQISGSHMQFALKLNRSEVFLPPYSADR